MVKLWLNYETLSNSLPTFCVLILDCLHDVSWDLHKIDTLVDRVKKSCCKWKNVVYDITKLKILPQMGRVYFFYKCMSERIRWKHIHGTDFLSVLYCLALFLSKPLYLADPSCLRVWVGCEWEVLFGDRLSYFLIYSNDDIFRYKKIVNHKSYAKATQSSDGSSTAALQGYMPCLKAPPLDKNFPCCQNLLVKSVFFQRSGFHHPVFKKTLNTTVNISIQHQFTIVSAQD